MLNVQSDTFFVICKNIYNIAIHKAHSKYSLYQRMNRVHGSMI